MHQKVSAKYQIPDDYNLKQQVLFLIEHIIFAVETHNET